MERTELRDAFFAETRRDPYTHLVADAWALGYEQALRDHELDEARARMSHGDRVEKAVEYLTDARNEAHAKALIALAETGKLIGELKL